MCPFLYSVVSSWFTKKGFPCVFLYTSLPNGSTSSLCVASAARVSVRSYCIYHYLPSPPSPPSPCRHTMIGIECIIQQLHHLLFAQSRHAHILHYSPFGSYFTEIYGEWMVLVHFIVSVSTHDEEVARSRGLSVCQQSQEQIERVGIRP